MIFTITEEDLDSHETLEQSDLGRKATIINGCIQFVDNTNTSDNVQKLN